jgi:uncharacterized membrane protein YozB (DUF420 family)
MSLSILPTINASLNFLAGIFLILGYIQIKKGNRIGHKQAMISAVVCSTVFLTSYLTYHYLVPGVTKYQGTGIFRPIYFTILITHTILATLIVPFVITAVIAAIKGNFQLHKKITKYLFPTWMYVSFTGVIIYLMLYIF